MLSIVRRDLLPNGVPAQYTHKNVKEPRNLVAKCSILYETIIMVQKKKNPDTKSTYDKVNLSFQSNYSFNIQSVNMLSKCSMFDQ